ncbi:MAG: hypothetical protein J3Q66DRAFT_366555 [Benniella sp.]|nr:MAG: hypothetical protein J3Q66DRAFT_366555 [Benniella sp.]
MTETPERETNGNICTAWILSRPTILSGPLSSPFLDPSTLSSPSAIPKVKTSRNARNNNNNNNDNKVINSSGNTPATSTDATDSKVDLREWVVPDELGISPYFSKVSYLYWHHWGYVQYSNSTLTTMEDDYKEFRRGLEVLSTADIVPQKIKKRARRVIERNGRLKFIQYAQERTGKGACCQCKQEGH